MTDRKRVVMVYNIKINDITCCAFHGIIFYPPSHWLISQNAPNGLIYSLIIVTPFTICSLSVIFVCIPHVSIMKVMCACISLPGTLRIEPFERTIPKCKHLSIWKWVFQAWKFWLFYASFLEY